MQGQHAEIYKEIHAGTGTIADRIRAAMVKHGITMQYGSFERLYYSWRKRHSLQPTEPVKTQPKGNLSKLSADLNQFNSLLAELAPETSNPLDLPPSQESDYKPFKLPTNHNDILLLSDIHVPYHNKDAVIHCLGHTG